MRLAVAVIILVVANAPVVQAQAQPVPKFEVASIKRCSTTPQFGPTAPTLGRLTVVCASVMEFIRQSYVVFADGRTMNVQPERIVPMEKSPGWIDSDLYTLEAKAEINSGQVPGQAMMRGPMMQALLEDRFKLKIHSETRQVPVYALTVGKDGLKLPAAPKDSCAVQDLDRPPTPPEPGKRPLPFCGFALIMNTGFDMSGATMAQLSRALSSRVDRKVIDKTGITGRFDVHLDWSNGELPTGPFAPQPPQPGAPPPVPSLSEITADYQNALQKIGLKLEPTRGPDEFLVIDHLERPSEN
jgi:uncharacterized protein (TIGR03435 family)